MPTAPTSGKQNLKRAQDQKAGKESQMKKATEKKSKAPMKTKKK